MLTQVAYKTITFPYYVIVFRLWASWVGAEGDRKKETFGQLSRAGRGSREVRHALLRPPQANRNHPFLALGWDTGLRVGGAWLKGRDWGRPPGSTLQIRAAGASGDSFHGWCASAGGGGRVPGAEPPGALEGWVWLLGSGAITDSAPFTTRTAASAAPPGTGSRCTERIPGREPRSQVFPRVSGR